MGTGFGRMREVLAPGRERYVAIMYNISPASLGRRRCDYSSLQTYED
jgi:hypothetical protein